MTTQCRKFGTMAILATAFALSFAAVSLAAPTAKSGAFYDVTVATAKAADGTIVATIKTVGKTGYHCNMQYPWKLTLKAQDGVTAAKTVLKKEDAKKFAEAAVVFELPYKAADAVKSVSASLKLSLCDEKQCQFETVELTWPAR